MTSALHLPALPGPGCTPQTCPRSQPFPLPTGRPSSAGAPAGKLPEGILVAGGPGRLVVTSGTAEGRGAGDSSWSRRLIPARPGPSAALCKAAGAAAAGPGLTRVWVQVGRRGRGRPGGNTPQFSPTDLASASWCSGSRLFLTPVWLEHLYRNTTSGSMPAAAQCGRRARRPGR